MISRQWFLAFCSIAAACATSYTPRANSRADLQRYVEQAAAVVREQGAAACAVLNQTPWLKGDYYIFVNELDTHLTVCHPMRPDLIGESQHSLQDANGKYITREMAAAASSPAGSGWVEYVWPRRGQPDAVRKSAYVTSVTAADGKRYLVGSGGYEMSP